jgi:hypothetical protein
LLRSQHRADAVAVKSTVSSSVNSSRSRALISLAFFYLLLVIVGVSILVQNSLATAQLIFLIPITLGSVMLFWTLPFCGAYPTLSTACAQSELRPVLALLSCLFSLSLAALLVDEIQKQHNPEFNTLIILELVFVLLLPLSGIFPTVKIPTNALSSAVWVRESE